MGHVDCYGLAEIHKNKRIWPTWEVLRLECSGDDQNLPPAAFPSPSPITNTESLPRGDVIRVNENDNDNDDVDDCTVSNDAVQSLPSQIATKMAQSLIGDDQFIYMIDRKDI